MMAPVAQHDRDDLPALADRKRVLADVSRVVADAWASFDAPRIAEPELTGDLVERLRATLPDAHGDLAQALDDAARVLDASVSPSRPLYLAYIGSSGLEVGVLASVLAAVYDANLAVSAGGADLVDEQALRWVAEFVGFPLGEGVFTSGGMTSNLTALLAAREYAVPGARIEGLGSRRVAVYCSDEAHHSNVRAAEACGIGGARVRRVDVDRYHRLDPAALDAALARDVADGVTPVAVVATAGTTLTGAVDPLDAIAGLCERYRVWLHVDGAYGLPAAAAPSAAPLFAGLARADSVPVDAHKWFGVQKPCSAVLLREVGRLQAAFGHQERYMLHEGDVANPVDRTLEYSRPLNSLRIWMSFRVHGAAQYRAWIESTLANARLLASLIRQDPEFELLHEPQLSIVCFRHLPREPIDVDAHNVRLARAMQRDGRIYLAPAVVDGAVCLRACFVNFRTTRDAVPQVLDVARELAAR
jgi:aromatic-L-amino-acid decarboxylase